MFSLILWFRKHKLSDLWKQNSQQVLLGAKINEPVSLLDDHMGGLVPCLLHQQSRDDPQMVFWENLIFEISKSNILKTSLLEVSKHSYMSLHLFVFILTYIKRGRSAPKSNWNLWLLNVLNLNFSCPYSLLSP